MSDLMKIDWPEAWRDINDFPGYRVSTFGRIKMKRGKVNFGYPHATGYKQVFLYRNGIQKHCFVHRLVAEAFIPNPENKPCVNHINRNRDDNSMDNLEWCTYKENANHPPTRVALSRALRIAKNKIPGKKGYTLLPSGRFRTQIRIFKNKVKYLGTFDTEKEARTVYLTAWTIKQNLLQFVAYLIVFSNLQAWLEPMTT